MGFVRLESITVAVARVVGLPSRRYKKESKKLDIYNTPAKLIILFNSEARVANRLSRALYSARTPLGAALCLSNECLYMYEITYLYTYAYIYIYREREI